jgi:predicted dehydrogenase
MTILIVGGGKMGMSHLALVSQYIGKSQVALCDRRRTIRMLFHRLGYRTFASVYDAVERLDRLDGILIATPTPTHAQLVRWAVERRLPFFVEKPLTLDVAESEELVKLTDRAGIDSQVGFVLRYVATFQRLRRLVSDKKVGNLKSYQASMRGNAVSRPVPLKNWHGDFKRGGGCLNEYGPHIIDLCRFIFGPVRQVDSVEIGRIHSKKADDWGIVNWTHYVGTRGCLDINWSDSSKRKSVIEFQAHFEYADVRADNSALEITWNRGDGRFSEEFITVETPVHPLNVGFYLRGEEFSLELEDFLSMCLGSSLRVDSGVPSDTTPRLSDGSEVDRLIDDIARKGGLK